MTSPDGPASSLLWPDHPLLPRLSRLLAPCLPHMLIYVHVHRGHLQILLDDARYEQLAAESRIRARRHSYRALVAGLPTIISPDCAFDGIAELTRLDPAHSAPERSADPALLGDAAVTLFARNDPVAQHCPIWHLHC